MINVIKFSGQIEPYSEKKVYNSAKRAGASADLAKHIAKQISSQAFEGMKTSEILKRVKALLKKENKKASLRFNLKKALKGLGPTGFPFEKYTAEVFSSRGFETKTNLFLKGRCCVHETDFTAQKGNLLYIGECKYRNLLRGKVHTRDALANYARFLDIKSSSSFGGSLKSLLVTNSKFTLKAVKYSKCVGVDLLGWKYPKGRGLEKIIEDNKLYPITILPSLKNYMIHAFIDNKIILAKDLTEKNMGKILKATRIHEKDLQRLIQEARMLL